MRADLDVQQQSTATTETDLASQRRAFGQRLRDLREQHGVSIEALAEITRISQVFIEALEAGAMDRLPGRVFGRGFVQNIAKNFGAEPEPWLSEFAAVWEAASAPSVLKVQIKNKPTKDLADRFQPVVSHMASLMRRGEIVKVALPVLAVLTVGYLGFSRSLVQNAWRNFSSHNSASIIRAKPLDLRPVDNSLGNTDVVSASGVTVVTAQEPASSETSGSSKASDIKDESSNVSESFKISSREESKVSATPDATETESSKSKTQRVAATGEGSTAAKAQEKDPKQAPGITADGQQQLVIAVSEPVRIRLDVDQGPPVTKELQPDTYKFGFSKKADMLIYDAAAVQISFNGKALGALGNKGRVRRLSFQNQPPSSKSM